MVAIESKTGDLLEATIAGQVDKVYVGEALDLQLNILIRPYRHEPRRLTLSEAQMWRLLSERTEWGIFSDRMEQLAQQNQRPAGREVTRDDAEGKPQRYYLYTIDATIYPQRPGTIDAQGCRIVFDYPTGVGPRRSGLSELLGGRGLPSSSLFDDDFSPFGSRLAITSVRPITAEPALESIAVQAIPQAGRPSDYRGAIGRYRMVVQAKPDVVKVGDPITLDLAIAGDGPMDLVQAPPLSELSDLTADFKVDDGPLPGLVDGDTKLFTTTIRPRSTAATLIPPIPFSFFDPEQEAFVTVHSDPISLTVEAAERLSLDSLIARGDAPHAPASADPMQPGQTLPLAPRLVPWEWPLVPPTGSAQPGWTQPTVWLFPPLLTGLVWLIARRRQVRRRLGRLASADAQFRRRLARATSPADVRAALLGWLARKTGEPSSPPSVAIGRLRVGGRRELAIGAEQLLDRCQRADVAIVSDPSLALDRLRADAESLIEAWKRDRRGGLQPPRPEREPTSVTAVSMLLAVVLIGGGQSATAASAPQPVEATSLAQPQVDTLPSPQRWFPEARRDRAAATARSPGPHSLTSDQARIVLEEAMALHRQAVDAVSDDPGEPDSSERDSSERDPAEQRVAAEAAAAKYASLVRSGIVHPALLRNWAATEYLAGRPGMAVANYRRLLKENPHDGAALAAVAQLERELQIESKPLPPLSFPWAGPFFAGIARLPRWISPTALEGIALGAWLAFWLLLVVRTFTPRFPWKTLAGISLMLCLVAAGLDAAHDLYWTDSRQAVVVASSLTLRSGDGETYDRVYEQRRSEGLPVRVLTLRDGWAKVQVDAEVAGWVSLDDLALI